MTHLQFLRQNMRHVPSPERRIRPTSGIHHVSEETT